MFILIPSVLNDDVIGIDVVKSAAVINGTLCDKVASVTQPAGGRSPSGVFTGPL